ncbi:HDOD domain-containing protein [Hydrogenophilus thermoluteolus]|nr:HDOD domain-containing protein [Hydrogenophilus thermoluteolus]MBW7655861.1 HDOD domain-containing protein [Hydrogenophilus thermoluteolus]
MNNPPLSEQTAQQLIARIAIPPRPQILTEIFSALQSDAPDLRALSRLVASDVALSAAVLKTVNSPFYGLRRKVESIDQAVGVLGLDNSATLVTGFMVRNTLATPKLERFWDSSARIALLSAAIAKQLKNLSPNLAYLFGLFRDCGIPLMAARFPDYLETLRAANAEFQRPFTAVEEERHQTSHAIVGSLLAKNWGLPEPICEAIAHHHELDCFASESLSTTALNLIATALIAEQIDYRAMRLTENYEWEKLGNAALEFLLLSEEEYNALCDDLIALLDPSNADT